MPDDAPSQPYLAREKKLAWMLQNCGDGFLSDRVVATLTTNGRAAMQNEALLDNAKHERFAESVRMSMSSIVSPCRKLMAIERVGSTFPEGGYRLVHNKVDAG